MKETIKIAVTISSLMAAIVAVQITGVVAQRIGARGLSSDLRTSAQFKSRHPSTGYGINDLEAPLRRTRTNKDRAWSWLLQPEMFEHLSAGGKHAALYVNGRLSPAQSSEEKRPETEVQSQAVRSEATAFQNIRVNNPNRDQIGHTQSETSIVANGSNIVLSFNDASMNSAGYAFSRDDGASFTHRRVPTPPNGFNLGDGVVVLGRGGNLFYSSISLMSNGRFGVGVAKSTDNGATFSTPIDATAADPSDDFRDKPWIAVDRNSGSPNRGNVYVSWTKVSFFTSSLSVAVSRSTDGGSSFDRSIVVSPPTGVALTQGSAPAVAPNGDLYVAYFENHSISSIQSVDSIVIVKSTDGGKSFSPRKNVVELSSRVSLVTGGNGVRSNSFPSFSIDGSGNLHIVYDAIPTVPGPDRADAYYVRSTDGGATFSTPLRINDDSGATTQLLPSLAVAPDGTIAVKWWDRRNDPINDSLTDVYMAVSTDGGASFGRNLRVTDHNWVFGPVEAGLAGGYHGDYDGIAFDGDSFFVAWSDERGSDPDVYFAQVPRLPSAAAPDFVVSARRLFDTVPAGSGVQFQIDSNATNGFGGALSLSASPAIPNAAYSFDSSSIPAGAAANLTISTTTFTPPGTYLVTVSATSGAGVTRKTNLRVNVCDPSLYAVRPVNITHTAGFTGAEETVKVDGAGVIHLVFEDDTAVGERGNSVFYAQSTDGGVTYSSPVKLSTNGPLNLDSTLVVDALGNVYVAWVSSNIDQSIIFGNKMFFIKSTDRGHTFSQPVDIHRDVFTRFPSLAADSRGDLLLGYNTNNSGTLGFLGMIRSTDGGATFSPITSPGGPSRINGRAQIAFDSTGAAYVLWDDVDVDIPRIKIAVAPDGKNFNAQKVVSQPFTPCFSPHMAVDRNDHLYVVFYNRVGENFDSDDPPFDVTREVMLVKSTDRGASFGPQMNLSNNLGQSTSPFISVDDSGRVSVSWDDTTGNDQEDIFVARSTDDGKSFGIPVNVSANSGDSFLSMGLTNRDGKLMLIWTDDSAANTDLFSAILAPPTAPPPFTLSFGDGNQIAARGARGNFVVNINRSAGFSGNVTVSSPNAKSQLKVKLSPKSQSTTGSNLAFSYKVKGGAPIGPQPMIFTGRDDSGREHTAILIFVIEFQ
jgi:hypothetical protein